MLVLDDRDSLLNHDPIVLRLNPTQTVSTGSQFRTELSILHISFLPSFSCLLANLSINLNLVVKSEHLINYREYPDAHHLILSFSIVVSVWSRVKSHPDLLQHLSTVVVRVGIKVG